MLLRQNFRHPTNPYIERLPGGYPEAPARFWKKAALSLDKKKEPIKGYDTKYKFEAVISWRPFCK